MTKPDAAAIPQRGLIITEARITCGLCQRDEPLRLKKDCAVNVAKAKGWRYTQPYGWLCKTCFPLRTQKRG